VNDFRRVDAVQTDARVGVGEDDVSPSITRTGPASVLDCPCVDQKRSAPKATTISSDIWPRLMAAPRAMAGRSSVTAAGPSA
jgi:hypothetical protein